jgi:hypothetical protein
VALVAAHLVPHAQQLLRHRPLPSARASALLRLSGRVQRSALVPC